jgi:hypothetical protein
MIAFQLPLRLPRHATSIPPPASILGRVFAMIKQSAYVPVRLGNIE